MTTEARMTELEAVNLMLGAIGEAPVTSLSVTGNLDLDAAKQVLTEVNRRVQSRGWHFNTDEEVVWTPDAGTGEITLGVAVMEFDTVSYSRSRDLVERNGKVWDRDNQTYDLGQQDVCVDVIYLLDFEECPNVVREYIAYRAAERFLKRQLGQDARDADIEQARTDAWAALVQTEQRTSDKSLFRDNYWAYKTLRR